MKLGAKLEISNVNSSVFVWYNLILCWLNVSWFCPLLDVISKFEEEKEKLFLKYEQLSKLYIFICLCNNV